MSQITRRTHIIPSHGGYRKLRSFQCAQKAYDLTVQFCDRYVDRFSRTRDQMVQAARSGVQNIAEGSMASATSRRTELKLTSVARSSLEELLLDYEDFLRQRGLRVWDKESKEAVAVRSQLKGDPSDASDASDLSDGSCQAGFPDWSDPSGEKPANGIICLIHQASYLLGRQLRHLEQRFLEEGGFTESMFRARRETWKK